MKICLAGRCRQKRMLCSRTFLGSGSALTQLEFPTCFILDWVQQSPPSALKSWLFIPPAKGAETPRLWCHNSKSLYPIHLNNLALPGALQQTTSKWNWESQNKLSDKATHHGQVQVSWMMLRTKHQIAEAAQINFRATEESSFWTKSRFSVAGLQLMHPLVARRFCFSWSRKPGRSFTPCLQTPLGIRVTLLHKEHSPSAVVHILILVYCPRLVFLENGYKSMSSKRLKSRKTKAKGLLCCTVAIPDQY